MFKNFLLLPYCLFTGLAFIGVLTGSVFAEDITCSAPDACVEEDALWQSLQSKDRTIFQNAFRTLRERDSSELYSKVKKLTFDGTDEDRNRALMIAQVIAQERRKIKPTLKTFDYWKFWYDTTDSESIENIIPTYLLFNFHKKITNEVASSNKKISDYQKWLQYTLENPEGRPDYLSEESLTQKIQAEEIHFATLPNVLETSIFFLTDDENKTLENYFKVFEVMNSSPSFKVSWRLPFSEVLDSAIKTSDLWENKFQSFLKCQPNIEEAALIGQLIELNPNSLSLNTCLRKQLKNTDDLPKLIQTLSLITNSESLRSDPYVRDAVASIKDDNPFTSIRVARQFALSPEVPSKVSNNGRIAWRGPRAEAEKSLNEERDYCEPATVRDFNYVETPSFKSPETFEHFRLGAPILTVKTPSGYLTGHDRGEFGGGLVYYADEDGDPQILDGRNIVAIIESDQRGIYWSVSGLNHLMPGQGTILRIDARTDDVSLKGHKRMPLVTRNVKLLESGDLFMDFWRRSYTSYKDGEQKVTPNPSSKFNPPVILTRTGDLISGCGD